MVLSIEDAIINLEKNIKVNDKEYECLVNYICNLACNLCTSCIIDLDEWKKYIGPYFELFVHFKDDKIIENFSRQCISSINKKEEYIDIPEGTGEILCNVEFKLAYGGKILLNTTRFHVRRGRVYGLLGPNGCGKSTLMKAIESGQLEGFPGADELMRLRRAFVNHDINGSEVDTPTIDFCLQEPVLAKLGREKIELKLLEMGFTEELIKKPIKFLSGGWKMMLSLTRTMLLGVDLLLLDEPTTHLDVDKIEWLVNFLTGPECENVTAIVVSHDGPFLNKVLTDVIHYENMRLKRYTGNLREFVEQHPPANVYFSIQNSELEFTFPKPGPLEGVKSKTKSILSIKNGSFSYDGSKPIFENVNVQCSQASRVACIGPNGAGKSTLIKLLVGELLPSEGTEFYKHENCRIGYMAQHVFRFLQEHKEKSPVEYVQWRYSGGVDKEALIIEDEQMTQEEKDFMQRKLLIYLKEEIGKDERDAAGNICKSRTLVFDRLDEYDPKIQDQPKPRVIREIVGRRTKHNEYEYEVSWRNMEDSDNLFLPRRVLLKYGFHKMVKRMDDQIAALSGNIKPLTTGEIRKHFLGFDLAEEFSVYGKLGNLSGGQSIKVVIGAAMWFSPHIMLFDEPANYLDVDSLGALNKALQTFEGGCIIISHNADIYKDLAPEVWKVEGNGKVVVTGADWVDAVRKKELSDAKKKKFAIGGGQEDDKFDALGNKIVVEKVAEELDRGAIKQLQKTLKILKKALAGGDTSVEDEIFEIEDKIEKYQIQRNKEKTAKLKAKEETKKKKK